MRTVIAAILAILPTAGFAAGYSDAISTPYDALRHVLVEDGWMPFERTEDDDCWSNKAHPLCRIYPEAKECAGSGVSPCNMVWTKGNETLEIGTVGERRVTVSGVSE